MLIMLLPLGSNTEAYGIASTALGSNSVASGDNSFWITQQRGTIQ